MSETIEQERQEARPAVPAGGGHGYLGIIVAAPERVPDAAASGRESDGVRKPVRDDVPEPVGVADERFDVGREIRFKIDVLGTERRTVSTAAPMTLDCSTGCKFRLSLPVTIRERSRMSGLIRVRLRAVKKGAAENSA